MLSAVSLNSFDVVEALFTLRTFLKLSMKRIVTLLCFCRPWTYGSSTMFSAHWCILEGVYIVDAPQRP